MALGMKANGVCVAGSSEMPLLPITVARNAPLFLSLFLALFLSFTHSLTNWLGNRTQPLFSFSLLLSLPHSWFGLGMQENPYIFLLFSSLLSSPFFFPQALVSLPLVLFVWCEEAKILLK
jgi:hypothetical protein